MSQKIEKQKQYTHITDVYYFVVELFKAHADPENWKVYLNRYPFLQLHKIHKHLINQCYP